MNVEQANAAVAAWRVKHESDYRRDFVSISGLLPLQPGQNLAGSAAANDIVLPAAAPPTIGRFMLDGERVRFEPAPGVQILLKDRPVTTAIDLRDDRSRESDELRVGDIRMVVHVSGDTRAFGYAIRTGRWRAAFSALPGFRSMHSTG